MRQKNGRIIEREVHAMITSETEKKSLLKALTEMLGTEADVVRYSTHVLQGGTVGEVLLLSGDAQTSRGLSPFSVVLKIQKEWYRHGDPDSWRREYELYRHGFAISMPPMLRIPKCYFLEAGDGVTQIWMEFVEGKTGPNQLHADELALSAERLGEFQAWFHLRGQRRLAYLRSYPAVCSSFDLWWNRVKSYLDQPMDGFPDELRHILNDYAARAPDLLASFDALPETLCQGDVHHDNMILRQSEGETDVYLIDWDSAGYGRMGEDAIDMLMEAFIYSHRDPSLLPMFKEKIMEGYCKGAKKGGLTLILDDALIRDITALSWGFRMADRFLYCKDQPSRTRVVHMLRSVLMDGTSVR